MVAGKRLRMKDLALRRIQNPCFKLEGWMRLFQFQIVAFYKYFAPPELLLRGQLLTGRERQ